VVQVLEQGSSTSNRGSHARERVSWGFASGLLLAEDEKEKKVILWQA